MVKRPRFGGLDPCIGPTMDRLERDCATGAAIQRPRLGGWQSKVEIVMGHPSGRPGNPDRDGAESVPESVNLREATMADWPAVAALLAQLGRPDVRRTVEEEAIGRRVYSDYLQRGDAVALVAERSNGVVGFIDVEFRTRLNVGSPQAWVPDLIVDSSVRGQGIGKALLGRALELAEERGCWGLALESANWRADTHAFYRAQGLKDVSKAFLRVLSNVEWPPAQPPSAARKSAADEPAG
jgi:GNAT superfamily N-acetyltransferase